MPKKTSRLSKLDESVLEAQMRCGSERPIGLVDAIAESHRTTINNVIERRHILRSLEPYDNELIFNLCYNYIFAISLSEFKNSDRRIISTQIQNA